MIRRLTNLLALTLALVALISIFGAATAMGYPDTRQMTCAAANALVINQGPLRLTYDNTPEGYEIYDLFNNGSSACLEGEQDAPAWAATTDSPAMLHRLCLPRENEQSLTGLRESVLIEASDGALFFAFRSTHDFSNNYLAVVMKGKSQSQKLLRSHERVDSVVVHSDE